MNTEDVSIREGKVFYDIRFSATAPGMNEPIHLIVNVEAQKEVESTETVVKRAFYYIGRMISAQKNTIFFKSDYQKLRKVYSIWILMDSPKEFANSFTEIVSSVGRSSGPFAQHGVDCDLVEVILLHLGSPEEAEDCSLIKLLDILLSIVLNPSEKKDKLAQEFNIPATTSLVREVNMLNGILARVSEEAEERGEKRGEKRGTLKERTEVALNLMKSLNKSAEEVLVLMGVPTRSRATALKAINERLAAE